MEHFIVKQIRDLKEGDLFVAQYIGDNYRTMDNPPRKSVSMIIEKGITKVIGGETLVDHYLHEHKGYVLMVTPFFNEGGRFEFKWTMEKNKG